MRVASFIVLLSFVAAGCSGANNHIQGYDCPELAKTFFRKSLRTTIAEFRDFDVDKQYAIYICGNQFVHPPMIHLAEPFARGGEKVANYLKIRLLETTNDLTVRDIILVFAEMSRQKTYDVAGDSNLMEILLEKVSSMKDPDWRQMSDNNLNQIRK